MTSTTGPTEPTGRKYRQRKLYDHASSRKTRAPEKADPVAELHARQTAEHAEMEEQNFREKQKLERELNNEEAGNLPYHQRPSDEDKRRANLQRKHDARRAEMRKRHDIEMAAEQKRNPLP